MNNNLDSSLLEGIHEDDHEKIISLKNNSFTNLHEINKNSQSIELLLLHLDCTTNIHEFYNNLTNNKNLLYIGISSIIIGSLIKLF
jgi:hypothetical protein